VSDYTPTTGQVRGRHNANAMMEHTPTTGQVRGRHNANATLEPLTWGQADAQFDRWLAEELRKAREEAWDECYAAGYEHVQAVNPYKIEEGETND
jgi:hypothetical protein